MLSNSLRVVLSYWLIYLQWAQISRFSNVDTGAIQHAVLELPWFIENAWVNGLDIVGIDKVSVMWDVVGFQWSLHSLHSTSRTGLDRMVLMGVMQKPVKLAYAVRGVTTPDAWRPYGGSLWRDVILYLVNHAKLDRTHESASGKRLFFRQMARLHHNWARERYRNQPQPFTAPERCACRTGVKTLVAAGRYDS